MNILFLLFLKKSCSSSDQSPSAAKESVLNVFVVDCSSPGGNHRIQAVQGAVMGVLMNRDYRGHASIICCYHNDAEIILEPTSSLATANRRMSNMKKSVMGNIGRGITVALEQIENALFLRDNNNNNNMKFTEVIMTIISHGKAHGLLTGTSDCLQLNSNVALTNENREDGDLLTQNVLLMEPPATADLCDVELLDAAKSVVDLSLKLTQYPNVNFQSIVIDADEHKNAVTQMDEDVMNDEGRRLAAVCGAKYVHLPYLTDEDILRYILLECRGSRQARAPCV